MLLLALAVTAVAARPAGAGAVGSGLKAWLQAAVGVQAPGDLVAPVAVTPSPPFALYQPTWLPASLSRRGVAYNPANVDPVTGLHHAYPSNTGGIDAARLGLRFDPRAAFFLLRDTGERQGGPELILLERRATPGEPLPAGSATTVLGQRGTLTTAADGRLFSAVVNGTWLQLWTTLGPADLTRVAQSLRLTDRGVGALVPPPGPTAVPAPSPVPGSFPAFQRPTSLPPSLDGSTGISYFAYPPGADGRVMPPPEGNGGPGPVSAAELARTPLLQRLAPQLRWAEQAWQAIGGGVLSITFGGPEPLTYVQVGPARLDGAPNGTAATTPAGRTVWLIGPDAGAGFRAHWTNGAPLDFQRAVLAHTPVPANATVLLWVHGDALVWLRSALPRRDLLQFVDGLTASR